MSIQNRLFTQQKKMTDKCLFIFIDESGNFDFSPTGTKYFVLTAVSTVKPLKNRDRLFQLRYQSLIDGIDQECFHATEDKQATRDQVFTLIKNLNDFTVDSVIAQKNKAHPSLYREMYTKGTKLINRVTGAEFYRIICQTLLQYIFRRFEPSDVSQIIIVMDSLFTHNKKQVILKTLKTYLKNNFHKPFNIYFHQAKADINCQIADYCGWAIYVKNEREEKRPLVFIKDKIQSVFPIFQRGLYEHYSYIQ